MAELLDRDLYRKIKRMDRPTMESLIREFYNMGAASVELEVDTDQLRKDISSVKGIGEARLNEIMSIIERDLKLVDKDET